VRGWHVRGGTAHADIACGSFTAAGRLAAEVAAVCDEQDHHAEIDVRYPDIVRVTTWSHDVGGLTDRDLRLVRAVSGLFDERRRPVD
jgi:4a-hydroxytetrahydrobiopterin dehydratase